MSVKLDQYYDRFDPEKRYVQHMFRADRTLPSRNAARTPVDEGLAAPSPRASRRATFPPSAWPPRRTPP